MADVRCGVPGYGARGPHHARAIASVEAAGLKAIRVRADESRARVRADHCAARGYFAAAGNPVSVYAAANGKRPDRPELHDNFSAVVRFPGGRYAVVSQTLAAWEHHQTAKITGTGGAVWASWSGAMDRTFEPT